MTARAFMTRGPIAAAMLLVYWGMALPAAAQSMVCPLPQVVHGPGILKETPLQIEETDRFLTSSNSVNRMPEVVADLRKRYPRVTDAEIENYLITAYCPIVAKLNGLSLAEQRARVNQLANQARVALNGH